MMQTARVFGVVIAAVFALPACAAAGDDGSATDTAALTQTPEYDAVAKLADPMKVETDARITATQSFAQRAIAFLPGADVDAVAERLLDLPAWTEVTYEDGRHPFKRSELVKDTTNAAGVRTLTVRFEFDSGSPFASNPTLLFRAEIKKDGRDYLVTATNLEPMSTCVGVGLFCAPMTFLEKGKMDMTAKVGVYEGGVIIDGRSVAKASNASFEATAEQQMSPLLPAVIRWTRKTP